MRITIATLHVRESAQSVALAAGCLKSNLPQKIQQSTQLVDLYCDQLDESSVDRLLSHHPNLIAFSIYCWNRLAVLDLCRQIRERSDNVILLAGGPEASADSHRLLSEGDFDIIVRGEGDQVFPELIQRLASSHPFTGMPGLLTSDTPKEAVEAAVCSDLESLPSPWLNGTLSLSDGCGVLWEVARGCHFNCSFCYDAKGHQGIRPLPLKRLKKELERFVANNVGQVWILDSTFNAPPGRGKQLLQLLIETAPGIHFHIEAKADLLDDETINLLSQLSCSVQVGLQSADPDVLLPLRRKFDRKQMQKRLQSLSQAGVTFGLDLIYGLPKDTHKGFTESLDFALSQQPNQIDIFPLAVLPGTELYTQREALGLDADPSPPYLITESPSYPAGDMKKSQQLAAATDIFYNRGRAVGFFRQLQQALKQQPSAVLKAFHDWLRTERNITDTEIVDTECWQPETILELQIAFTRTALEQAGQQKLVPYAEDLILYHFSCAETILAENCVPESGISIANMQRKRWKTSPHCRIERLNCPADELEMFGGESLTTIAAQVGQDATYVIFLKQGDELIVETLDDHFAQLLLNAQQEQTGAQLIAPLDRQSGEELLTFAVTQGLLVQAT